jgi:hypothetical protein
MSETIKRRDALKEMSVDETRGNKLNTFSIQFYKQNGELVSILRAKSVGLRANMNANRLRGIQAVDALGNQIGHIYAISIDNIRMLNSKKVYL